MKHSRATRIQVCLLEKNDSIVLLYADNGIGFNPDKVKDSAGLGIKSVKSRIEMLGGKMTLNTTTGKGVEYSFEVTAA